MLAHFENNLSKKHWIHNFPQLSLPFQLYQHQSSLYIHVYISYSISSFPLLLLAQQIQKSNGKCTPIKSLFRVSSDGGGGGGGVDGHILMDNFDI